RFAEAINIGDKIIAEIEQLPDLIHLRAGLIQWQIEMGDRERALKEYREIMEDIGNNQEVLDKITEGFSKENNKTVESDQVLEALLDKESNADLNSRITGMLNEVDNLKSNGDYNGARLLILKWRLRADEPDELAAVNNALASLDLSETEYLERLKTDTDELIAQTTKLIEEEEYESAINMIDMVKNKGENNPEIDKKRAIAVEKLIDQERNRAARIFLAAKKTNDIRKKRELLLSARDILAGLVEEYPSSGMAVKIKSYLNSVNDELIKTGDQ
ncbi:MAG: hypothetical protein JW944_03450, partial [Deltaproteobacteria bacterium]|nr:hypothetical protein [Deltaproteobacteria bacterium]